MTNCSAPDERGSYRRDMRAPDTGFADPLLAVLYDFFDDDRSDLDVYDAIVDELGARKVVDVGCGTGSLAVRLAARDIAVTGVDPAVASIDVGRTKPYADRVTWWRAMRRFWSGSYAMPILP